MAALNQDERIPGRGLKILNLSLTKIQKISNFRTHEGALAFLLFLGGQGEGIRPQERIE
jgi:hypothetical protein